MSAPRTTGDHEVAAVLREWLPRQRWYAGKGREVTDVGVTSSTTLREHDDVELRHLVVAVRTAADTAHYQLLLGLRDALPDRLAHVAIGEVAGRTAYDAAHDNEVTGRLLELMADGAAVGPLRFSTEPGVTLDPTRTSLVMGAEQSNTSLVYGDDYILKLFRRLAPGRNPDLELHRALASVDCPHIAAPLGAVEGELAGTGGEATFAMLQRFLKSGTDGWQMATTSVRDLYAEADLHADEVGGDFAAEASRLGAATARVHADLAQALGSAPAPPDDAAATAAKMRQRLEAALALVPELAPYADGLRSVYDEVAGYRGDVTVQRIHGDLHLGQVLRTDNGWVVLDFEGEPARPLAERTAAMSPLRDVAGMLRSFDYAARHLLADHAGEAHLAYRATEWAERNREAFCDGYADRAGEDPRKSAELLRAFELDKAVYEVVYEAGHRPTWLAIPLGSIERLVGR